jgi:iron complex transport system substrate-binding protein
MNKNYLNFFLGLFVLVSCGHKNNSIVESDVLLDSLQLQYANGFAVNYYADYKELIVYNPWEQSKIYAKYYLVKNDSIQTPSDGKRILIPLKSLAATSVTQFEFLHLLSELETVTGVCSPKFIYNSEIRKRVADGEIADLGDAFNINVEKTLQLEPDAVMMSGYNQNDPYAQRVNQSGIPVIFNNEWMENSLLARAEWLKFVAVLYNKEHLADSIFNDVSNRYNEIKLKAQGVTFKPKVMAGSNFRGTWYVPSGQNFMGKLFADAGADYFYSKDTTVGSLPLNVETVLKNFSKADIWLNCNFNSLDELLKSDSKHALFNPVKTHKVYNFNKRYLKSSANDFWESAVAHPDLLLSDLISVLHPDLLPNYELVYTEKLK